MDFNETDSLTDQIFYRYYSEFKDLSIKIFLNLRKLPSVFSTFEFFNIFRRKRYLSRCQAKTSQKKFHFKIIFRVQMIN